MEGKKETEKIDLLAIFKEIMTGKKLFYKVLPITFIASIIIILGYPRYYSTDIKLAPELNNSSSNMGTLSSIASSFGFDLNDMQTSDAITPLLYPNLMEDNKFICGLFDIKVKSIDGKINTTYHDYLQKQQKPVFWLIPIGWIKKLFANNDAKSEGVINPYFLNRTEHSIADNIRNNVSIKIDKKTAIITISAEAQDPMICKTIADSIRDRLQEFIIDYRTSKARNDYEYYKQLAENAKHDYERSRKIYASFSDASTNIALKSIELKMEDMENDLQLKYNTYTTLNTQLQSAKAKVQERTPAFTVIKGAEVPVKPSGPKRMIFVISCVLISFAVTSIYILSKGSKPS